MNRNYTGSYQVTASAESSCVTPLKVGVSGLKGTPNIPLVYFLHDLSTNILFYSVTQCYRLVDCYTLVRPSFPDLANSFPMKSSCRIRRMQDQVTIKH